MKVKCFPETGVVHHIMRVIRELRDDGQVPDSVDLTETEYEELLLENGSDPDTGCAVVLGGVRITVEGVPAYDYTAAKYALNHGALVN